MTSRAPLITAIFLLLLPVLYVGSYLAMVVPQGIAVERTDGIILGSWYRVAHYRAVDAFATRFFWPLEQIDRKVRPGAWE
jgi:hypothetical protein